jgi:hypothetical protein
LFDVYLRIKKYDELCIVAAACRDELSRARKPQRLARLFRSDYERCRRSQSHEWHAAMRASQRRFFPHVTHVDSPRAMMTENPDLPLR